jgi:holo-[acyl-carrier protein] synthase
MIRGVGIDIVAVRRFERWLCTPGLPERFFHPDELAIAVSRGTGAAQSLAARFAAKEALGKALGTGLSGISLRDIAVNNDPTGTPYLTVYGSVRQVLKEQGICRMHLSLSHEKDYAAAVVVLEMIQSV